MFSGQLVCRTQSHSPGCVSRPFPFALGQIQVHLRPLGKKQTHALGEHEPPASTYRSQGKKAWLQPGCFRHSTAKACQSFQACHPLLLRLAQNTISPGKSSRIFTSQNNCPSFGSQCTFSDLFLCFYLPHNKTFLGVGTILLYFLCT